MGGSTSTPLSFQDAKIDREAELIARCLVERILAMVASLKEHGPQACDTDRALSLNEVYSLAKRMLVTREKFRALDKPTNVILGYHYTEKANLVSIRKHGLMNQQYENPITSNLSRRMGLHMGLVFTLHRIDTHSVALSVMLDS
jgi:hypothetical protein